MNKLILVISLFFISSVFAQQRPAGLQKTTIDDDDNFTSVGNIGLTITNFGLFGDGYVEQSPVDQPS
jgi:hypothetical protein